jgi:FkbM family methyltransferase
MDDLTLKRMLVGTWAGDALEGIRDRWGLLATGKRHYEEAGNAANDMMCRKLMVGLTLPGTTFLDIGAHIGSVSGAVQKHSPGTKIVAFEAIPEKADNLRKRFPAITVHNCAISSVSGDVTFYISLQHTGYSSLDNKLAVEPGRTRAITVKAHRLDDLPVEGSVDIIKVDVEGAEQGVFEGGQALIAKNQPLIFFESGPGDQPHLGFTKVGIWTLLDKMGYGIIIPTRLAHADTGMALETFLDSHLYPRRTNNYLAVPRSRRDEYRQRARALLGFTD